MRLTIPLVKVERGQHAIVKNSDDENVASLVTSEKNDVPALLDTPILRHFSKDSSAFGIIGEALAARLEIGEIAQRLVDAPH